MKRSWRLVAIVGAFGTGAVLGASAARGQTAAVHVDSATAAYKELAPGASAALVWGDMDKGPYGAFTKFVPGANFALHTHSSDIRIVVLKGAYVYKPEKGAEVRVGAGQYIFIPGGDRHVSGGDAKEGAVFYQTSAGKFDLNPVK
jgi:mannose-6-phosphate isomerase-like protein (cupin superfamily)